MQERPFGVGGSGAAAAPAKEKMEVREVNEVKEVRDADHPERKSARTVSGSVEPTGSLGVAGQTDSSDGKSVTANGLEASQVLEIKAGIQAQQKFIGELIEHASRWELEGMELRIYFPSEKSTFSGLIEGRDTLEKIRSVAGKVLGRAVRVCAKLETGAAKEGNAPRASTTQEIRAQFENDPIVKSMLQRFGGRISEVRRQSEE